MTFDTRLRSAAALSRSACDEMVRAAVLTQQVSLKDKPAGGQHGPRSNFKPHGRTRFPSYEAAFVKRK